MKVARPKEHTRAACALINLKRATFWRVLIAPSKARTAVANVTELVNEASVPASYWGRNLMPQDVVEQWLFPDGYMVKEGNPLATIRIKDALHEVMAPCSGRLSILVKLYGVFTPDTVIATISRQFRE